LVPLERPLIEPERHAAFRAFVQSLFGRRRKQLANTLRSVSSLDRAGAAALLADLGIPETARPEQLPVASLVALFRLLGPSVESGTRPPVDFGP
jgi:16S rRNA (adenine1518-N6/adenine1519-N6)-dimethyltransferase